MNTISEFTIAAAIAMSALSTAFAQQGGHDSHHAVAPAAKDAAAASTSTQMSEGEIRKVDKDAKKITIKHGDLKNLGMPPMTMAFQVQDPAILDQVKAGDKVNFVAAKIGGKLMVTKLEPKK
jgi:Cu(I)/Ag(I) efflux system periplasmic protein CusF